VGYKVYIGGPITNLPFNIKNRFKSLTLDLIEHLTKREYEVYSPHRAESFGEITLDNQAIVTRDFKWLEACDFAIMFMPLNEDKEPVRSDGTFIEIGWLVKANKPIIFYFDDDYRFSTPMLEGLGTYYTKLGAIYFSEKLDHIDDVIRKVVKC
jgi:nucleoside 2-deoxyribosyltransferase